MSHKKIVKYSYHRILKTIGYRLTASLIAQLTSWLLFRRIEVNMGVLTADLIQMAWYYLYEGLTDYLFPPGTQNPQKTSASAS